MTPTPGCLSQYCFFCCTGDGSQGLLNARQRLYTEFYKISPDVCFFKKYWKHKYISILNYLFISLQISLHWDQTCNAQVPGAQASRCNWVHFLAFNLPEQWDSLCSGPSFHLRLNFQHPPWYSNRKRREWETTKLSCFWRHLPSVPAEEFSILTLTSKTCLHLTGKGGREWALPPSLTATPGRTCCNGVPTAS